MARDHAGAVRGFHNSEKAWYANRAPGEQPSVMIGMYHPDGGTSGEFIIRWRNVSGVTVPRLEAFSDSWSALHHFGDVIARLAELDVSEPRWDRRSITVEKVCALLLECGVRDMTESDKPKRFARQV